MNHGYCKNCWWYRLGFCYFHDGTVKRENYCPDYCNRTKGNKDETLEEWIKEKNMRLSQ